MCYLYHILYIQNTMAVKNFFLTLHVAMQIGLYLLHNLRSSAYSL